jgi:hypothetical protein
MSEARGTLAVTLAERILSWLDAHPGEPQSVAELAAAIPEATRSDIVRTCVLLRMQGAVGRNGADTTASPHRYYMKRKRPPGSVR